MQNKPSNVRAVFSHRNLHRLSQSPWLWHVGLLIIVLPLVVVVGRSYEPLFREFFAPTSSNPTPTTATSTASPAFLPTHPPPTQLIGTPTPQPTYRPPLTLVWSKEYSQVYLRQEPGGEIIRLLDNCSSVLISEVQTVQGVEWAHVLYFDGEENVEGWVAASQIFTVRSNLPLVQVTGENGANLRAEPGGALVTWLPFGTPMQLIETAEVDGVVWAHVILPDERGGWVALRLLDITAP
jgi:hypothetical protein